MFHLIPENAVMSGDDFVPGILEPQPDGNSTFLYSTENIILQNTIIVKILFSSI